MPRSESSIPKFGSFQPKPTPTQSVNEWDKGQASGQDSIRHRHGHHKSRRPQSKERRRDLSRDRRTSLGRTELFKAVQQPSSREELDDLFVIDRKGDVKNLVYGSVHRYSVPSFHRSGAGSILGIPSYMRIDRDYEDEKGIVLSNRTNTRKTHGEKYIFSKIEKEKPRLLKLRQSELQGSNAEVNYLSLQIPRGKKRKRSSGESSGSEDGNVDYRSIHGKAKPKTEPEDEVLQYATESDSESEEGRMIELDTNSRQKTVDLSRTVEQSPYDVGAWLALINHQDAVLQGDRRRITNAEMRSTADIKIHMYEQALEKAQSLQDRETLLLGLMAEGAKIWELKTQSDKWEKLSKENIDSLVLWRNYLDFRQTTFGTFQYEETRDVFLQRTRLLLRAAETDKSQALYEQIIYILLRLTTFIRESGYTELAVAIWQALLEFNFFVPPKFLESTEKINSFKEFWESEIPRIGEEKALGWRHAVEHEGVSDASDPMNDEEGDEVNDKNAFRSWVVAEHSRARTSRLPARTMDDVAEDDPFRVILASDLEDFLIFFPIELDGLRSCLLDAFLLFCRMPCLTSATKFSRQWSNDTFIGNSLLECAVEWLGSRCSSEVDKPEDSRQIDISSFCRNPLSNFQTSPESMFNNSWLRSMPNWRDVYGGDNGPLKFDFLRCILQQLLQVCYREDLAEYYLALEWRNKPESIRKISKSLIKQHPSSLRLYNAYAMIEMSRGNRELADGVYSAALDMAKSLPLNERDGSLLLWKSWIWAYLDTQDTQSALSRILSIASDIPNDEVTPTPFQLLKSRQHLSQRRDYSIYSGSTEYAVLYAECLALLSYLTSPPKPSETQSNNQGNIVTALEVYADFSQTLQQLFQDGKISTQSHHELFLQSATRLLYHHARSGPYRPALLRTHLTAYLTLFPQNTIFLNLYIYNESRLQIDNRVRSILSSTILTPINDTLTSRVSAIHYEIRHGTIHSVRAAFEHALKTPAKHSPGLWRFYILYCLRTPKFKEKSKEVWYRAIRSCPWAKELYVTGFEGIDAEGAELLGTWKVMGEKGLRVHVDLEDALERRA